MSNVIKHYIFNQLFQKPFTEHLQKQHRMLQQIKTATEAIDSNLLIVWGAVFVHYKKGDCLFKEDEPAHFYYQVVKGKIKMANIPASGKEFIQGFFTDGQSFGEVPLFDGQPYPATAIALQATVVIRLHRSSFMQLLQENFDVHLSISRQLSQRLRGKTYALKEITCHTPTHRIIALLDQLKKDANLPEAAARIKITYTRKQIADLCGIRVETVIRVMRDLFEKNILVIEKGKVYY